MKKELTTQQKAVLTLLKTTTTANTFDIQRKGIRNPSQVVGQLINLGVIINVDRKPAEDDYGHLHDRIAFYTLVEWSDE
ncbi:hypothetical protein [Rheinheimera aquimaris]|uniref:hypothetical protein n=1 Tax=Rheinheimera aquimaris TaxID=412437 RepID=UPI003A9739C9